MEGCPVAAHMLCTRRETGSPLGQGAPHRKPCKWETQHMINGNLKSNLLSQPKVSVPKPECK